MSLRAALEIRDADQPALPSYLRGRAGAAAATCSRLSARPAAAGWPARGGAGEGRVQELRPRPSPVLAGWAGPADAGGAVCIPAAPHSWQVGTPGSPEDLVAGSFLPRCPGVCSQRLHVKLQLRKRQVQKCPPTPANVAGWAGGRGEPPLSLPAGGGRSCQAAPLQGPSPCSGPSAVPPDSIEFSHVQGH